MEILSNLNKKEVIYASFFFGLLAFVYLGALETALLIFLFVFVILTPQHTRK